jgi:hypothetical protein
LPRFLMNYEELGVGLGQRILADILKTRGRAIESDGWSSQLDVPSRFDGINGQYEAGLEPR